MLYAYEKSPINPRNYRAHVSGRAGEVVVVAAMDRKSAVLDKKLPEGPERDLLRTFPDKHNEIYLNGTPEFLTAIEAMLIWFGNNVSKSSSTGNFGEAEGCLQPIRDEWRAYGQEAIDLADSLRVGRTELEIKLLIEESEATLRMEAGDSLT